MGPGRYLGIVGRGDLRAEADSVAGGPAIVARGRGRAWVRVSLVGPQNLEAGRAPPRAVSLGLVGLGHSASWLVVIRW